jgi:carbon storage regulator
MLVLSRKANEVCVINPGTENECSVTVVEIRGDKVRLGFAAKRNVPIYREEVWVAITREADEVGSGEAEAHAILTDMRELAKRPELTLREAIECLDSDGVLGDEPEPNLDDTAEFVRK